MWEPISVTIVTHVTFKKQGIEKFSKIPGVVYSFTNQYLVTFEDNIGNKGDLRLVACVIFETTMLTENILILKQNTMFLVSYTLIFAFHQAST